MERIVIKHINGSKVNQIETFPLEQYPQLTLGRDPSSNVKYDPELDELVSRHHAKIEQSAADRTQFVISDLNSRNGIFVNKEKINENTVVNHGDVIQLGAGGPEFIFELDPPPPAVLRATRVAEFPTIKPTREDAAPLAPSVSDTANRRSIGRVTVERLIAQNKSESRKYLINGSAALLGVIALVTGTLIYKDAAVGKKIETTEQQIIETRMAVQQTGSAVNAIKAVMSPKDIAAAYSPATVFIETSWKLVDTETGRQVYHYYITNPRNGEKKPAYIRLPNGTIEPWLITDHQRNTNEPIGGTGQGSGFVVTENGFVLTNRHVAAPWFTSYSLPPIPGKLFDWRPDGQPVDTNTEIDPRDRNTGLYRWVPAKSILWSGNRAGPKLLEGRHDTLDITFPKNKLRIPAKLVRISNEHDVAMIKVDTPQAIEPVKLNNNYDTIRPGDAITILGYPGISPNVQVITRSQDPFNPVPDEAVVPDPTVTPGVIGKIIRGAAKPIGGEKYDYYSDSDSYQLTATATGQGNSGGPVFDEFGRVIGIFYASNSREHDARITFAVPIKFGMDLMQIAPVLQ